jgi:murein DD-endopeptidase MepM/ murein hydrolase activator NlpD
VIDITEMRTNGGYRITLEHEVGGEKFYSYYFHLQKFDPTGLVGTEVKRGDVIGQMGETGTIGGKHLHFEVRTEVGYLANDYWANSTDELHTNWVDISPRFGGHDATLPEDY